MSEQIMRDNLTVLAQAYANAKKWSLATVSKKIHGKHSFLEDFIAGRASTALKTYFGMVDKLRADWPKGTPWPVTREVPKLSKVPYNPTSNARPKGPDGKFLGKKAPKGSRR